MSHYQSFPGQPGAADSTGKLASLLLPPLAGKSFLDVGCNEGFFCGYASFEAAQKVVGIDKDENAIKNARERFPACDFRRGDWEELDSILEPDEKFDVILMISAIHYSRDQNRTISELMQRLKPDGKLILEIGVIDSPGDIKANPVNPGWYEVQRSIDSRLFPDHKGISSLLEPYAYKHGGKSVMQIGDPVPRHIYHIQNKKPVALVLSGAPASGKSTLAKILSQAFNVVKGDELLCKISARHEDYGKLGELISDIDYQRIDLAIMNICQNNLLADFVDIIMEQAHGDNFVYDGFIPKGYGDIFTESLESKGYIVNKIVTKAPDISLNAASKRSRVEARKYQMFLSALESSRRIRKHLPGFRAGSHN